jgi:uncharacterized membrane protein YphA (DoxX/SURF4 family)
MCKLHNLAAVSLFSLFFSPAATAHVKWFVDTTVAQANHYQSYGFFDLAVLIWIAIGCLLIGAAILLDIKLPNREFSHQKVRSFIVDLLSFCCGLSLLVTAIDGSLIAPHYIAHGGLGYSLLLLQVIVGVLFVINRYILQAAVLLLILYAGLLILYGLSEVIEYLNYIGIALFLLLSNVPTKLFNLSVQPFGIAMLRMFTGVALIALGISEKLLGAKYGQAFIATYDWNFMANLGLEFFSDQLFVLSAGVMEVVFGIILILGVVTRINILVIAIFMLASNITFVIQSNQQAAVMELIGHLPIIASALVLLLFGNKQALSLFSFLESRILMVCLQRFKKTSTQGTAPGASLG